MNPPHPHRLLMITERFAPDLGGVARSASRISRALGTLDVEVHVLAWTRTLPAGELQTLRPETPGAPTVHRLGTFANLDLTLQHTMNVLEFLHEKAGFTAIWGHYLHPPGFLAVLAGRAFGIPSLVAARGNDVDRLMFPPGDFARLTWTLQHANVVAAVSRDLAKKLALLVDRPQAVEVVPNAVDPVTYCPSQPDPALRGSLGILPVEAVLGFCGELRHKKGLPFILQALSEVRATRPACLLVIGEVRTREAAALSTYAAAAPEDAARILVTGPLDDPADVARHLRLCDLLLSPSVWDGLPNAVLEAMACGIPVLASDAGGIPEAVEHGVSGLLLPKSALNRLGEAILEFLAQPPTAAEALGAGARARILADFDPETERRTLRRLIDLLHTVPPPR